MGMYTGLFAKIHIKPQYDNVIYDLHNIEYDWTKQSIWSALYEKYGFSFLNEWSSVWRCNFIPFGALCYMPDDFPEQSSIYEDGWWKFSCSLKNYENEINTFFHTVVLEISDNIEYYESLYEEDAYRESLYEKYTYDDWRKYTRKYLK